MVINAESKSIVETRIDNTQSIFPASLYLHFVEILLSSFFGECIGSDGWVLSFSVEVATKEERSKIVSEKQIQNFQINFCRFNKSVCKVLSGHYRAGVPMGFQFIKTTINTLESA